MSDQPHAGQPVYPDDNPQRDNVGEQHEFGIDEHDHGWAPHHGQVGQEDREADRQDTACRAKPSGAAGG